MVVSSERDYLRNDPQTRVGRKRRLERLPETDDELLLGTYNFQDPNDREMCHRRAKGILDYRFTYFFKTDLPQLQDRYLEDILVLATASAAAQMTSTVFSTPREATESFHLYFDGRDRRVEDVRNKQQIHTTDVLAFELDKRLSPQQDRRLSYFENADQHISAVNDADRIAYALLRKMSARGLDEVLQAHRSKYVPYVVPREVLGRFVVLDLFTPRRIVETPDVKQA